jgi:hypothetical protein
VTEGNPFGWSGSNRDILNAMRYEFTATNPHSHAVIKGVTDMDGPAPAPLSATEWLDQQLALVCGRSEW